MSLKPRYIIIFRNLVQLLLILSAAVCTITAFILDTKKQLEKIVVFLYVTSFIFIICSFAFCAICEDKEENKENITYLGMCRKSVEI